MQTGGRPERKHGSCSVDRIGMAKPHTHTQSIIRLDTHLQNTLARSMYTHSHIRCVFDPLGTGRDATKYDRCPWFSFKVIGVMLKERLYPETQVTRHRDKPAKSSCKAERVSTGMESPFTAIHTAAGEGRLTRPTQSPGSRVSNSNRLWNCIQFQRQYPFPCP